MAPVSKKKQKKLQKQRKRQEEQKPQEVKEKEEATAADKKVSNNKEDINNKEEDAEEEKTCGLCFEEMENPAVLACKHKICWDCLEKWKSKYDETSKKTCPFCREKIPPSRQLAMKVRQIRYHNNELRKIVNNPAPIPIPGTAEFANTPALKGLLISDCSDDLISISYVADPEIQQTLMRKQLESMVRAADEHFQEIFQEMNGWTEEEILDDRFASNEVQYVELPENISLAAFNGNQQKVLKWLGKERPVPKERLEAKIPRRMDMTLLHEATVGNHTHLMKILLQLGADVNSKNLHGGPPLAVSAVASHLYDAALLLLEWGANKEINPDEQTTPLDVVCDKNGNHALRDLLRTPLGGRRCELFGLRGRSDLNGLIGVASTYNEIEDRYVVKIGKTGEVVQVRSTNLKRRDRTPTDYK